MSRPARAGSTNRRPFRRASAPKRLGSIPCAPTEPVVAAAAHPGTDVSASRYSCPAGMGRPTVTEAHHDQPSSPVCGPRNRSSGRLCRCRLRAEHAERGHVDLRFHRRQRQQRQRSHRQRRGADREVVHIGRPEHGRPRTESRFRRERAGASHAAPSATGSSRVERQPARHLPRRAFPSPKTGSGLRPLLRPPACDSLDEY